MNKTRGYLGKFAILEWHRGSHDYIYSNLVSSFFSSAWIGGDLYSIMASEDGSVLVHAMNITEYPPEKDDDSEVLESLLDPDERQLSLRGSIRESSSSRNLDDGSVLDIMCVYTRQTVCQEAIWGGLVQASDCDATTYTNYKYLMNDKCQLAVAQSVRKVMDIDY